MLQSSDQEDASAAETFLQQLTQAVSQSQAGLEQMSSQVSNLQNETHSLNAARSQHNISTNQQASGHPFNPTYPPMFQGTDVQQGYRQVPLIPSPENPQIPSPTPFTTPFQQYNLSPPPFYNSPPQNHNNNAPPTPRRTRNNYRGRGGGRYSNRTSNWNDNNWSTNPDQANRSNFNNTGINKNNHYCWTHGKGGHPSAQCRNPHPNHQW